MSDCDRRNELEWAAFAYVAGEMPTAEAEAFEAQLADDQQAREAVACAVELTQVVAAAESQAGDLLVPARRETLSWTTRLSWMAIGGLASLLVVVVASSLNPNRGGMAVRENEGPSITSSLVELALAWSETRAELAASDLSGSDASLWYLEHAAVAEAQRPMEIDVGEEAEELLTEAPSWMTAGVYGLAGRMPEDRALDDGAMEEATAEPFTNERGDN